MSGISIKVELQDEVIRQGLQDMLERMENRRPFLDSVGERLILSASDNFRNERAPDGTPWTPLRPATIKSREHKGQVPISILRANSRGITGSSLAGSINKSVTDNEVAIGSPVEYAAIHQLGGTISKPPRSAKIYRMKDEAGQVGRRFVKKDKANHLTDVTIPAHKITIPARPYLGVSEGDRAGIMEDAENWLMR